MHCEIIDRYLDVFFVEIQLKKENLRSIFWTPEFVHADWYTGLPNGLNTSLQYKRNVFRTLSSIAGGTKIVNS